MLQHALLAVRADDRQRGAERARNVVFVRVIHRAGMKRGDLIVVEVGGDERLRGELSGYALQMLGADAQAAQALEVGPDVLADRRHDERILAEELQVVRDVARGAAIFAAHLRRKKADVEDVQLIGQQVVTEAVGKHHDGVVGDRTGDQCFHEG